MMINELNTGLIEALKEKLPPKTNLANLLMDTLCIGREAIYRRLRGEVPFTLEEAALISRKLGVSLDKIVGVSFSANAVFDLNVVDHDDPFNAYFTILSRYVKIFRAFQDDPTTALGTSSNTIPQTLYLKHDLLSKFRLFKWMYQNKHIQCNHFENLKMPEKLVDTQREFVSLTQYIHSTDYIWDNMIFHHLVNDIKYFSDIHLISCEDIQRIKEELLVLVVSRLSPNVNGGRIEGRRLASMDFPLPGAPISRILCPPAAATSNARFTFSCPFTSEKSRSKSCCRV